MIGANDPVRAVMYYKEVCQRVDGEIKKFKVFVDWGESRSGDYVISGAPFQAVSRSFTPQGVNTDCSVLFVEELVPTSIPQDSHSAPTVPSGPVHYKPGINV